MDVEKDSSTVPYIHTYTALTATSMPSLCDYKIYISACATLHSPWTNLLFYHRSSLFGWYEKLVTTGDFRQFLVANLRYLRWTLAVLKNELQENAWKKKSSKNYLLFSFSFFSFFKKWNYFIDIKKVFLVNRKYFRLDILIILTTSFF